RRLDAGPRVPPAGPPGTAPPPPPPAPGTSRAITRSPMAARTKFQSGPHTVSGTLTLSSFWSLIEQQGASGRGSGLLTGAAGGPDVFVTCVFGSSVLATSAGSVGSFSRRSAMAASEVGEGAVLAQPVRSRRSRTAHRIMARRESESRALDLMTVSCSVFDQASTGRASGDGPTSR